jgi:predicted nuclease of predicted toxin-antitoxin system
MKLKLDENLQETLVSALFELGHDVDSVRLEGLEGCDDGEVWAAAQEAGRILITQDLDFSDIRRFVPGRHFGLVLVRLRSPGRMALSRGILQVFSSEAVLRWERSFVVVTDLKIRVHSADR